MKSSQPISGPLSDISPSLLAIAIKYRFRLLGGTAAVAAITFIGSMFVPDSYSSTTTILNPERTYQHSGLAEFVGVSSLPPGLAMAAPILKSRTTFERLIKNHDLAQAYGEEDLDELVGLVEKHVTITQMKDGTIKITVKDRDPRRAAEMANDLVNILRDILLTMSAPEKELPSRERGGQMAEAIYGLLDMNLAAQKRDFVYVLDEAQPAKKPDSPKRLLLTLMGALLGFFGVFMHALIFELRLPRMES